MKSTIVYFKNGVWSDFDQQKLKEEQVNVLIVFAERALIESVDLASSLQSSFPKAHMLFCSTAGEIMQDSALENSAVCVAIHFEKTELSYSCCNIKDNKDSFELGKKVASLLPAKDLQYVWMISDGNLVNGDDLLSGIHEVLDDTVSVSGGIAGDGTLFQKTLVGLDNDVREGNVVMMGLHGKHIRMGSGFKGGWDVFGPERKITSSKANVLYEIDNENALDLYKKYLGKYAEGLPSTALFFPISVKTDDNDLFVVRTILSIDEKNKTMTFAGNVPEGAVVRFMKSNVDHLINASSEAATAAMEDLGKEVSANLALMVSCVGRKLVLSNRVDEEIEAAKENLSEGACIAGFFSYGEISPQLDHQISHVHNQTMTITTFAETI